MKLNSMKYSFEFTSVVLILFLLPAVLFAQGNFNGQREQMVQRQIAAHGIIDKKVLQAFRKVERHRFVLPHYIKYAYSDSPLPIEEGQTISQPYIVAFMTDVLDLERSDKVLEVGTGSGYQAAILDSFDLKNLSWDTKILIAKLEMDIKVGLNMLHLMQ